MNVMEAPWEYDVKPFQITDNVWYVGNSQVASHLIDTGDGLVLLDTGWPSTLYLLLESIRDAGFRPAEIRYLLHSHAHVDHIGGTRRMMQKYGCRTMLGENDQILLKAHNAQNLCGYYHCEEIADFEITDPISQSETFRLGNTEFQFVNAPGHTPGTLGIFFNSSWRGRPCRVGMHGGVGQNTLESVFLKTYSIDPKMREAYADSLQRLMKQHVDVALGNHPAQLRVLERRSRLQNDENPYFDDSIWPNFLKDQMRRYERMMREDPIE